MPKISELVNIILFGILIFGAFVGFIRGGKKATFFLAGFGIFFIIMLLIFPLIINIGLTREIAGFSARTELMKLLSENNPDLLVLLEEDSLSYSFLSQIIIFLAKHIWLPITVILGIFILPIFTSFFWLIIGKKEKKTFASRLIGAVIGSVHTAIYATVFIVIMAGIISIAKPAERFIAGDVPIEGIVQLDNEVKEDDVLTESINAYYETFIGIILNKVKIKQKPLDLYIYDQTFNIRFNKQKIFLREELVNILELVEDVAVELDDEEEGSTFEKLAKMDEEILTDYVDRIASIKLFNVVIPIAVENVFSGKVIDLKGFEISTQDYQKLMKINYQQEIKKIGYIGIDVLNLLYDEKNLDEINFLGLDPTKVERIFNNIGELELLNITAPIGINLLLETDDIKKLIGEVEVNLDDFDFKQELQNLGGLYRAIHSLNLDSKNLQNIKVLELDTIKVKDVFTKLGQLQIVDIVGPVALTLALEQPQISEIFKDTEVDYSDIVFKDEFVALGNLYEAVKKLGIQTLKFEEIQFDQIEDEKIIDLSNALFGLQLVRKSTPSVINYLINNLMPEDVSKYISPENIKLVNWNEREVSSILLLGKLLMANGALDSDFNFANLLTESTSQALAKYMSQSELISGNLTPLIKGLLEEQNMSFLSTINIDDDFEWSEDELYNIFTVARITQNLAFEGQIKFSDVSNETLEELASAMSESQIITQNLTPIFTSLVEEVNIGIKITVDNDFEWSRHEINSILQSVKIIESKGGDFSNIFGISDEEIDVLLGSELITKAMISLIYEYTQEGSELDGILVVKLSQDDRAWYDEYDNDDNRVSDGELRKLLKSLGILLGDDYVLGDDINFNLLSSLTDEEIDLLLDSQIVTDTVQKMLIDSAKEDGQLAGILVVNLISDDPRWYDSENEEGELRKVIRSFKFLFGEDFDFSNPDFSINQILSFSEEDINTLINSQIMSDSIINQIYKLSSEDGELYKVLIIPNNLSQNDPVWYGPKGELKVFIQGIQVLVPEDENLNNLDINLTKLYNEDNLDKISRSQVLLETIYHNIESSTAASDSLVVDRIREEGEFKRFIKGIEVLIPDGNIDSFEPSIMPFYNDDNLDTLLESYVITDTIIKFIQDTDNEVLVTSRVNSEGELKRFFKAVKVIIPDGEIENYEPSLQPFYDEEGLDTLLDSFVVYDTIIKYIKDNNNDVLVSTRVEEKGELKRFFTAMKVLVPSGEIEGYEPSLQPFYDEESLDTLLDSFVVYDTIIKYIKGNENEMLVADRIEEDGELKRFFTAMKVILPDGNIDNYQPNLNQFYDDEKLDTLLASLVISDTMIKYIYDSDVVTTGILVINLTQNDVRWYDKYVDEIRIEDGELRKFIRAIEVILPGGEIENVDFSVDIIYEKTDDQIDTLFASKIVNDSVIKEIVDKNPGVLNTSRINSEGELARLIKGFKILIPNGDVENIDLDVEIIKLLSHEQLDTIISSRVLEDSIIEIVEEMFEEGGVVHMYFKTPADIGSTWERTYNLDGSLQVEGELLPFIESIQMMEQAGMRYDEIGIGGIIASESGALADAVLHSPIISKSISKMFNQILVDAELDAHPPYPLADRDYTRDELIDIIEGIKFIALFV